MDGGGRFAEPLMPTRSKSIAGRNKLPQAATLRGRLRWVRIVLPSLRAALGRLLFRRAGSVRLLRRGIGIGATALLIGGSLLFGVVRGNHTGIVIDALHDIRDAIANAAGFRISAVALSGNRQTTREEVL